MRSLPRLAAILVPAVRGKSQDWIRQWSLNEAESRELLIALATLIKVRGHSPLTARACRPGMVLRQAGRAHLGACMRTCTSRTHM